MGILPGWWLGVNDGRTEQPYLPSDQWDRILRDTGFSGVDAAIFDAPEPWHINANIISRPAENISKLPSRSPLSLLLHQGDEHSEFVQEISSVLAKSGFQMELCTLQNPPPAGKDIVSVLELKTPFFESISQADLVIFQGIVGRLEGKHLLWITRPAQENVLSQPGFGLSLGLSRTLRSELDVSISTLEVDRVGDFTYAAIARLLIRLHRDHSSGPDDRAIKRDTEFILSGSEIQVGRYHRASLAGDLDSRTAEPEAVKLEVGKHGLLQSLRWVPCAAVGPGYGEVVVEPRCAGLNFRVSILLSSLLLSSCWIPPLLLVIPLVAVPPRRSRL